METSNYSKNQSFDAKLKNGSKKKFDLSKTTEFKKTNLNYKN